MAADSADYEYISCLRETANQSLAQSNYKEALSALLEIKKLTPNDSKLLLEIGDLCLRLNNALGAKYYYEHSRRIDASNIEIYSKLALLYQYKLNKPLVAEEYYESIFLIDAENSFAYFNLGKLYIQQNRDDDAQIAFKKCVEMDSHNALYHHEYGKLLERMRDFDGAEWELKQAMLMDDKNKIYNDDYNEILCKISRNIEGIDDVGMFGDDVVIDIISKRWNDSQTTKCNYSLQHEIQYKAKTLLSGFCRYPYFTMDIVGLCYVYLMSNYPSIIYDDTLNCFNEFGIMEIEGILFHILCPGKDGKTKIRMILLKLIDILNTVIQSEGAQDLMYEFTANYMSYLLSSSDIIDIYATLKGENGEDIDILNVVDIATKMIHFDGKWNDLSFVVLIWSVLCRESDVFYLKYRININANVIDVDDMLNKMENSDLSALRVNDMRNIAMPLLFDDDIFDVINGSSLGIVYALAVRINNGEKKGYKICIYWIELELKLIHKKYLSDNINNLLNNMMIQIWKRLNEDNDIIQFHYDILTLFMKKGICLKPMAVEWGEFYAIIAEIVLKDDTLKDIVLKHCQHQLRNNIFPKNSWKQCIALLS